MAILAQQAELYAITQACTLAKDKTANIYPNNRYGFGVTWLWNVMKAIWLSYFQ